jgi:hypothetical protein
MYTRQRSCFVKDSSYESVPTDSALQGSDYTLNFARQEQRVNSADSAKGTKLITQITTSA